MVNACGADERRKPPMASMRVLSWNLLKRGGASAADVGQLVERHRPDLVLLQEATQTIDALPGLIGGN